MSEGVTTDLPHGVRVGYVRVSSADQNPARQEQELSALGLYRVFSDKASGKDIDRPGFSAMMSFVREGDEVVVCSMDRLARNLEALLQTVRTLNEKQVTVRFLKEGVVLSPDEKSAPFSKLLLSMLGAVAEFERELIRERQREGIALAKARGIYRGRKPVDPEKINQARALIAEGVPVAKVARKLKVGRTTLYRYLGLGSGFTAPQKKDEADSFNPRL